jgi:uncharacterized membrane protein YdjX (TVP38/TMEM64 family)
MKEQRKEYTKRIIGFSIVIALAILFFYSLTLQKNIFYLISRLGFIVQQNHVIGIAIFVIITALGIILSPFSGVPLIPVAITAWGKWIAGILVLTGWMIGAAITYLLGRSALYPLLKLLIPLKKLEYYRKLISGKVTFGLVVLFRFAMPVEVPGYVLGIIKYPLKKYMFASLISFIPFSIFMIYASHAFLSQNVSLFII